MSGAATSTPTTTKTPTGMWTARARRFGRMGSEPRNSRKPSVSRSARCVLAHSSVSATTRTADAPRLIISGVLAVVATAASIAASRFGALVPVAGLMWAASLWLFGVQTRWLVGVVVIALSGAALTAAVDAARITNDLAAIAWIGAAAATLSGAFDLVAARWRARGTA